MDTETAESLRAKVDEMRGALRVRGLRLVEKEGPEMAGGLPFVEAEPVPSEPTPIGGRGPFVVLGDQVVKTRLRGGLAVLETKSGVTVLLDARAAKLACLALGVSLVR